MATNSGVTIQSSILSHCEGKPLEMLTWATGLRSAVYVCSSELSAKARGSSGAMVFSRLPPST